MHAQTTTAVKPAKFTLMHTTTGGFSSTIPPGPEADKETLRYGVAAFGHLLKRGTQVSGPEFAARIREASTHPKAREIANTLERY